MMTDLEAIQDEMTSLKLDDSLLELNHILSVSVRRTVDPVLEKKIAGMNIRPPAHIVHFLAKQLLLNASNLGHRVLNWPTFIRLMDLAIRLGDPILHDPDWKDADPTGFFERILAQQIPSQAIIPIQKYGLALALFRDVGVVEWPKRYDLKAEIEAELGISVEQFMAMGFACLSFQQASSNGHKCMGTYTCMMLAEAFVQGVTVCVPEVWNSVLPKIACDREAFRETARKALYRVSAAHFAQFEFNPLHRFPIIEVQPDHFVAVDPYLIIERTTLGLFYDLFERAGRDFTTPFGHAFDRLIGQLLGSVCPTESLWSATEWEMKQFKSKPDHGKIGDWVFVGSTCIVLFECKSLRPTLELTTYGSDDSVQKVVDRIASALEQLIDHNSSIQAGQWEAEGLPRGQAVCVVVTYGRISTINGPFTRKRIHQRLSDKGLDVPPFVVLSLEELDIVVRLVETGKRLDDIILTLSGREPSFNILRAFEDDLKDGAVSSFAFDKANAFLDRIVDKARYNDDQL